MSFRGDNVADFNGVLQEGCEIVEDLDPIFIGLCCHVSIRLELVGVFSISSGHRQSAAAHLVQALHEVHASEFEVQVVVDVASKPEELGFARPAP